MRQEVINENHVRLIYADGRVINIYSDVGTACHIAAEVTDWSAMFAREDAADEITQIIALQEVA